MRYHYQKKDVYPTMYGETYTCNHPIYNRCTLYKIYDKGLAVIQQRYDECTKHTWWGEIDVWLTDDLYLNDGFKEYFDIHSGYCLDDIYPTVTIRQIMWALHMKPLPKEPWETVFDRKHI